MNTVKSGLYSDSIAKNQDTEADPISVYLVFVDRFKQWSYNMSQKIGKEAKFLNSLKAGRSFTRRQAKAQFKLGNPSATVHRLVTEKNARVVRQYTTQKIKGNYITTVRYSLA